MENFTKKTDVEREGDLLNRLVYGALNKENIRNIYGDIDSVKFAEMVFILANQFDISGEIAELTIARFRLERIALAS